jgi:hypothetical protein
MKPGIQPPLKSLRLECLRLPTKDVDFDRKIIELTNAYAVKNPQRRANRLTNFGYHVR